jgi:hypothetical protein
VIIFLGLWFLTVLLKWHLSKDVSGFEEFSKAAWFLFIGLFLSIIGFAPLLSSRIRKQWCRPEPYFESAKRGLVSIGLFGALCSILGWLYFVGYF